VAFDTFNEERVVSSTPYSYLVFSRDLTNITYSESDLIVAPNIAFWAVMKAPLLADNPQLKDGLLGLCAYYGWGAFTVHNVSEYLFGYTDDLLVEIDNQIKGVVPTTVVQYIRNQTSEQDAYNQVKTSTVSCGFPNTKRFQQIVRWQQNATVDFWLDPFTVYGSPGNFFGFFRRGSGVTENLFWAQVARTLPMEVEIETEYQGVSVYRYIFPESVIENGTTNPENKQFFQDGPKGLFNATAILKVPIFYSWPHFYQGDPTLLTHFEGPRAPDPNLDNSYIEVQPIIGANCHSSRKVQGNLLVGPLQDPVNTKINITDEIYFPLYWMDIQSAITDAQAEEMRNSLAFYDTAKVGSKAILFSCSLISPVLFGIAVVILWRRRNFWRREGEGQLLGFGDEAETGDIAIGYDNNKKDDYGTR